MKNIEKSLVNYVNGRGPKVSDEALCDYAQISAKNSNEIIDILFRVINDELDKVTGTKPLDKVNELIKSIQTLVVKVDEIDKGIVERKLKSLYYRLDHLQEENKNKFIDIDNAIKELEILKNTTEGISTNTTETKNKQYDFINYLVEAIKNITYIEQTFARIPSSVNAKDKEERCLFQNLLSKYMNSIREDKEEDILYYSNLLSLVMSQKEFNLSPKDKKKSLEIIYTSIDKLSIGKKNKKRNSSHIDFLNTLVDAIKGDDEKEVKIDSIASKYNISIAFNPEVIVSAKVVKTKKSGIVTDREVIDDYIITIDKSTAVEIDDGLSCKRLANGNYLLGVHAASVLAYFDYNSIVVQEALNRNRSIYLPKKYQTKENDYNRVIPIFPYSFSAEAASLLPNEERFARSYIFEITPNGEIVREEFKKTIVKVDKKTSYEEIDEVMKKGSKDKKLQETVRNLKDVTNILDKKYRGTSIYENIKGNMDDFSSLPSNNTASENIVYRSMVLTGHRVALYFARNNFPCLYRVHEVDESEIEKLEAMAENLNQVYGVDEYKKLYQLLSGIYPSGWYGISGHHVGLKLEHYCKCTSELRSAPDIVVEHCLEICYDKQPTEEDLKYLSQEVLERAAQFNAQQSPIDWFIKDYKRVYKKVRD